MQTALANGLSFKCLNAQGLSTKYAPPDVVALGCRGGKWNNNC